MAETTFPEFLTARRRELELTLGDVASEVGVSPITVSNWSNGQSRPHRTSLVALAGVLEIPAGELADLAGVELDPEPEPEPGPEPEPEPDGEVVLESVEAVDVEAGKPPEVGIPTVDHPALDEAEVAALQAAKNDKEVTSDEAPDDDESPDIPYVVESKPLPAQISGVDVVPRVVTAPPTPGQLGPLSYVQDPKQLLRYRIRWGITTVALIIMAFVLVWALAGLIDSLSDVKESVTPP